MVLAFSGHLSPLLVALVHLQRALFLVSIVGIVRSRLFYSAVLACIDPKCVVPLQRVLNDKFSVSTSLHRSSQTLIWLFSYMHA